MTSSTFHHPLPFSAELHEDGRTRFRVWAPSADTLQLELNGTLQPMQAEADGWYSLAVPAPAGSAYRYVMPDGLHVPDPASRSQRGDVHDPSLVVDPTAYRWQNPGYSPPPWHHAVIYELHAGLLGGFNGVRDKLPELKRLGVTVIELMPIADFAGSHNWGYDGVLPFSPDASYGTPDELKAMIDAAHGIGLSVMLDVVYNHFGPDGAYIHVIARDFFTEDVHTPWGAAIDFRRPQVRDFYTQNALYWLNEFRFDGLRFDAVNAIIEESFLTDMVAAVRAQVSRPVYLVIEHDDNPARLLSGSRAFDGHWCDDLHHVVHTLLTGEFDGYYEDYDGPTARLARCLAEGYAYQGEWSKHAKRERGEPSGHLPPTSFVICLQNHDQTGNRAMGERLTVLADPPALQAATAMLLLSPMIPLLFMGEEYASKTPFLFFTDHHDELADLVREGRRSEFGHFAAFKDVAKRAQIPDPNAPETFKASVPEPTDPAQFAVVQHLLALRQDRIVPGIPGCSSLGATVLADGAVRAAWRMGTGGVLTIGVNLGTESVALGEAHGETIHATAGAGDTLPPGSFVARLSA